MHWYRKLKLISEYQLLQVCLLYIQLLKTSWFSLPRHFITPLPCKVRWTQWGLCEVLQSWSRDNSWRLWMRELSASVWGRNPLAWSCLDCEWAPDGKAVRRVEWFGFCIFFYRNVTIWNCRRSIKYLTSRTVGTFSKWS